MTPRQIWIRLSEEARKQAALDLAELIQEEPLSRWAPRVLARAINFRPSTIQRAEPDRLAGWILQGFARLPVASQLNMLVTLHIERRQDLLVATYDELGIPHDGLSIHDEGIDKALDPETTAASACKLADRLGVEPLWLCFAVMSCGACPDTWREGVQAAADRLEAMLAEPPPQEEQRPTTGRTVQAEPEDEAALALEMPEFSTLDRTLIRAAVSAVNHVEGSLALDHLDDLTQEVLELNDTRSQSFFHRGFVDALMGRAMADRSPGDNKERRAWYLVGHFLGELRTKPNDDVLKALFGLPKADYDALVDPAISAGAMMLAPILPLLLRGDHLGEAERWMKTQGERVAPQLVPSVMAWTEDVLITTGDPAPARRIARLLRDQLQSAHEADPDEAPWLAWVVRDVERRLAILLRAEGQFIDAQNRLDRLLSTCENPDERARLLGHRAMVRLGVRSLEGFAIPHEPDARGAFFDALAEAAEDLLECSKSDRPSPIGLLGTAMPIVCDGDAPEAERSRAADYVARAIDSMNSDNPAVWEASGLLGRARFYHAVLQLRSLEGGTQAAAVARLHTVLLDGAELPDDLLLEAVRNAALVDAPRVIDVACSALERFSHKALTSLDVAAISARSSAFRQALVQMLEEQTGTLSAKERWGAWLDLLSGAMHAAPREVDLGARALDALELIAHTEGYEAEWLHLLADTDIWDPAWSRAECDEARVQLYLRLDRRPEARTVLAELAHGAITRNQPEESREYMCFLEELGGGKDAVDSILARWEAAFSAELEDESAERVNDSPLTVLFVGGNETQERYVERLRSRVLESHPSVTLDFENPGWSANWGRSLNELETRLARADAIVLMQFVRTGLGKAVRNLASTHEKPWVPCTGHGFDSCHRAIVRAIDVAGARERAGASNHRVKG